jgi:hypothetical protein
MRSDYNSIPSSAETPLLKKEDSISKRRFTPAFVAALVVAAVLGTVAVQHIAAPRSSTSTDVISASIPRIPIERARVGASPTAVPSSHEHDEPTVDEPEFDEDEFDEDEDQLALYGGLGSALKSAASLGGCKDKKVSGCATHKKSKCGLWWYDNGCSACWPGYKKNGDWQCSKCSDKKVSNCMFHKKEGCGGGWVDNGKCETCNPVYKKVSDTYCKQCRDENVDHCLIPEKSLCGAAMYDNGKCASCAPGCQKSSDKKNCNCQFWEDQWDQVKEDPIGYAADRIDDIEDGLEELNDHIEDAIDHLKDFFAGLECDVNMDVMKEMFDVFADNVSPDFNEILKVFQGKQDSFAKGFGGPMCDYIWKVGLPGASLVFDAVNAVVEMVDKHCPALSIDTGGKVPTVTLGFTVDAGVTAGGRTASVGAEIGLGFSLRGDKICYVGGCVESGFKIEAVPDPPFGVEAGIAVTLFNDIGSVPGSSNTISLGIGVDIPAPVNFGGGMSGTLVSSGGKLIGVSVPLGIEPSTGPPDVELSFAEGLCLTPVCVTTEGEHCSSEYVMADAGNDIKSIFGAEAEAEYEAVHSSPPPSPPPPAKKTKKTKKILG